MSNEINSDEILTMDELSNILKMDRRTIQNRIVKSLPLPPSFKLPSSRARLWRHSDVTAWINQVADEYIEKEKQRQLHFEELIKLQRK